MAATTYVDSIRIVFALSSCALHAFILSFSSGTLQTSKIYLPSTKSVVAVGGCNVRRRKVKLKRSKEQKNYSPHGVEKRPSFTFANGGTLGLTLSTAENRHKRHTGRTHVAESTGSSCTLPGASCYVGVSLSTTAPVTVPKSRRSSLRYEG